MASWKVSFAHYGPDPVLSDIFPFLWSATEAQLWILHCPSVYSYFYFTWNMGHTNLQVLMVKSLTNKQVHSAHLHSHFALLSDWLAFTLFVVSYSSVTYKVAIFPQKCTITTFSAKTTQAKGIPDIYNFITLTSFVGQNPIWHCPIFVFLCWNQRSYNSLYHPRVWPRMIHTNVPKCHISVHSFFCFTVLLRLRHTEGFISGIWALFFLTFKHLVHAMKFTDLWLNLNLPL